MANTGVELRDVQAGTISIQGVTVGATEEELVAALERRGLLAGAELAGLQRRTIITLAQRLKPAERLDFEQAVTELERAVEVALDVIARGERGTNDDAFVNTVLARVAERVRSDDLDGGAQGDRRGARGNRSGIPTVADDAARRGREGRYAAPRRGCGRPAYRDAGRRRSSDRPARLAAGIPRAV